MTRVSIETVNGGKELSDIYLSYHRSEKTHVAPRASGGGRGGVTHGRGGRDINRVEELQVAGSGLMESK